MGRGLATGIAWHAFKELHRGSLVAVDDAWQALVAARRQLSCCSQVARMQANCCNGSGWTYLVFRKRAWPSWQPGGIFRIAGCCLRPGRYVRFFTARRWPHIGRTGLPALYAQKLHQPQLRSLERLSGGVITLGEGAAPQTTVQFRELCNYFARNGGPGPCRACPGSDSR